MRRNWLSIKRAAEEMDVSVSTIKRWLDRGLPSRKEGRIVRIHVADLDTYMNIRNSPSKLTPDKIVDSMLNLG
jgi:excisionase family DNA binding protein